MATKTSDGGSNSNNNRPQDPPATQFESDPILKDLLLPADERPEYFGLVLVAAWPPSQEVIATPYNNFINQVRQCFDEKDLMKTGESPPSVYLYDSAYLHVTIATLHPLRPRKNNNESDDDDSIYFKSLEESWKLFVKDAAKHSDWPKAPLRFQIDSCQIGTRAGIVLWKETTGGLRTIRTILSLVAEAREEQNFKIHSVPGIIHSTFLRFHDVPTTDGEIVQSTFQTNVLNNLNDMFKDVTMTSPDIKLVCERIPYMHSPNDEHHVIATFSLL